MASLHVWRAIEKARNKGGYAGNEAAMPLWNMSKRELVEIACRLGEICAPRGGEENGIARAIQERETLFGQGIL